MPRNYYTTGGLPYPRVGRIVIDNLESGPLQVEYIERTAIVDASGAVRMLDGGGQQVRMHIPPPLQPVQLVDPATGAVIAGTTSVRELMLGITAMLRRDQLLRDGEVNPLAVAPAPPPPAPPPPAEPPAKPPAEPPAPPPAEG
jgi:hypothetical protein